MSVEADDWTPVKTAAPDDDWTPVAKEAPEAPTWGNVSESIPEAFLDRVRAGQAISRIVKAAGHEAQEPISGNTPTGFHDESLAHLIDMGVFHDPLKSRPGPIQMMNEAVMMPAAQIWQAITGTIAAGIHGAGGAVGQIVEEFGGSQGTANRAKNEVINAGNWAMIEGGFGRFSRPQIDPKVGVMERQVGGLPAEADFANAGRILAPETKLPSLPDGMTVRSEPDSMGNVRYSLVDQAGKEHYRASINDGASEGLPGIHGVTWIENVSKDYSKIGPAFYREIARDIEGKGGKLLVGLSASDSAVKAHSALADVGLAKPFDLDTLRPGLKAEVEAAEHETGKTIRPMIIRPDPESLGSVVVEQNLRRMWKEDGITPAEAVHDAQHDAFIRHDIKTKPVEVTLEPAEVEMLTETGGRPGSLSAAASLPDDVPLSIQPAQPPGSLMGSVKAAADELLDIGKNAQMLVAPMATGTNVTRAVTKDFANSLRRIRWDWDRIDTDIAKRFTPEQRARMWTAADEESVSLQLGEPASMRAHQGLSTLEPAERAAVEDLQTRAQAAWLRARDLGMVEGEGLPAYTPRMIINTAGAGSKEAALALDGIGSNLKTKTSNMLRRKYLEAQETEAAAKAKYGDEAMLARDIRVLPMATAHLEDAIAGRTLINHIKDIGKSTGMDTVVEGAIPVGSETKWFTLDHPAFKTWRPKMVADAETGAMKALTKNGDVVFEQVPLYVHGDFEGNLKAVLSHKSGALYGGLMSLKAKTMSVIMNSPMIHNAVEWGRALPAMPGKVLTFKVYFEGYRAKHDVAVMREAIDNGLVPIGHRFFNQDISGLMEAPDMTPGRSWTAKVLAAVPGLFDEAAGVAVKRSIDKAGDFWHNTLLWDRVADLQMGLYVNLRADAIAKGIDPQTSSRMAAHWANRYAGALPREAMSDAATKISNMLLFSRSFTMGNLGVIKDMLTGLPKDVLAQIERDMGVVDPKAVGYAKSMARRKAMGVVVADMALLYVGNSLLQNVMNVLINDSTLDKELHGYAQRMRAKMDAVKEHPLELVQPLRMLEDLGATASNEPGRKEKIHTGFTSNGTAIYMRQPAGKIGEEFVGYMTGPLDMMRKKLGTIARPAWQIMSNDAGFGRKVYDADADTPAKYLGNLGLIAAHLVKSQFPVGQLGAFSDLVKGEGDAKLNAMQAFGPFAGVTFSKGAPGGPAVGEMYASKREHDFKVNQALPDIRRQIQRGDIDGAIGRMTELDIPQGLQRFYIKTTLNPATRLSPRALRDFYLHATPEQRERFERAQRAAPAQ